MEFFNSSTFVMIIVVLFGISEALAAIPSIKANSVYQLVAGVIKWLYEKMKPAGGAK